MPWKIDFWIAGECRTVGIDEEELRALLRQWGLPDRDEKIEIKLAFENDLQKCRGLMTTVDRRGKATYLIVVVTNPKIDVFDFNATLVHELRHLYHRTRWGYTSRPCDEIVEDDCLKYEEIHLGIRLFVRVQPDPRQFELFPLEF